MLAHERAQTLSIYKSWGELPYVYCHTNTAQTVLTTTDLTYGQYTITDSWELPRATVNPYELSFINVDGLTTHSK